MMMSAITVLSALGLALYALIAVVARVVVYWGAANEA
jgi:ABC-type nitrate/sulfonate/bicarbonate transport system permease component